MALIAKLRAAPLALGYWSGVAGARERAADCARILMFHGTPRRLAAAFEGQMRFLRRAFEVVPLAALVNDLQDARALRHKVALTFDDGLKNNVEVAYPVLARLGLPATFFVCPELVRRGRWLWNQEARQRLAAMAPARRAELAAELGAPAGVEAFVAFMKALEPVRRQHVEQRIREASAGWQPSLAEREEFDLAGWDDLRRMDPCVVTIGSHTLTHSILPTLAPRDAEEEVVASRRAIEAALGREANLFAYPNGDHSAPVREQVRRAYRAAVTTLPSWLRAGCDPHLLPRASVPGSALRLAWNLHTQPS